MARKKTTDHKTVILAEGEATGHAHRATGERVTLTGTLFCAPDGAIVTHEEHRRMEIPAGDYEIRKVVELDPAGDKREVVD